jgi:hypothetical protein
VRLVAVDGPSGAGKSTVAAALAAPLRRACSVAVVPTDHFATWTDPVAWWPRLLDGVLLPLRDGRPGRYHPTDWSGPVPRIGDDAIEVPVPDILLVEGVSAGRASVRSWLTHLVWVDLPDPAKRLVRSLARDGEPQRAAFQAWQRFEAGWFAVDGTRAAATTTATS